MLNNISLSNCSPKQQGLKSSPKQRSKQHHSYLKQLNMDSGSLIVQTSMNNGANKINLPQIGSLKNIKLFKDVNNAGSPVSLENKR